MRLWSWSCQVSAIDCSRLLNSFIDRLGRCDHDHGALMKMAGGRLDEEAREDRQGVFCLYLPSLVEKEEEIPEEKGGSTFHI